MKNLRQVRKPKFTSRPARTLGFSLLAVLATAAVTASTASASLPEWGGCEPAAPGHGKYSDPACVKKVTLANKKTEGNYEWYTGAAFGFVHQRENGHPPSLGLQSYHFGENEEGPIQIGKSTFETAAHKKMECQDGSIYFLLENANTKGVREVWLSLHGCESEGLPCRNNGSLEEGEISNEEQWLQAEGLKGTLGYISGKGTEHPVVGLSLTAFNTKSENIEQRRLLFATCEAPGPESVGNLEIGGNKRGGNAVIALVTPVDQMATEHTLTYTQSAGVQTPSAFEGKTGGLMGFTESTWQPLGFETSFVIRPEGRSEPERWTQEAPIEIKAIP